MASKADFTEQEWEELRKGVTGAGMLVSLADRSFFDTFKEAGTMAKHLGQARGSSESQLIRELAQGRGSGFGFTASPDEIASGTLDSLRSAVGTLEQKAPDQRRRRERERGDREDRSGVEGCLSALAHPPAADAIRSRSLRMRAVERPSWEAKYSSMARE